MLPGLLFEGAPRAAVEAFERVGVVRAFAAGASLFRQGEFPERLMIILEGEIRIWRRSPRGGAMTVRVMRAGDVPGCVAVFQRIAYPANATAQSDCRVITWPAADAPALLAADPAIALNAVRMLGGRTLDMLLRLHEVSAIGVEPRVARAILREVEEQAVGGRSQRNEVRLSRRALAELSATTLHTVSRLVSGWSRDGIVIAGRGRLVIRDAPALAARALRGTGEV